MSCVNEETYSVCVFHFPLPLFLHSSRISLGKFSSPNLFSDINKLSNLNVIQKTDICLMTIESLQTSPVLM